MNTRTVSFSGNEITVEGRSWLVEFPIAEARVIDNRVIVVYDYMARKGAFQNLEAFTLDGERLWTAENPVNSSNDAYTNILAVDPLTVGNFAGFTCKIDLESGRLLEAIFTK